MSVFLFAVVDPDLNLPPTSITYYREKISLPPESDLTQVFIILSSTTFSHIPQMLPRGLELVMFNGKLRDSEQMISISNSELTELWTSVLEDFSKIFHVTFRLHPSVVVPGPRSRSYRIVLRYTTHRTLQSVVSS